ncbi:MAG: glycine zipper domain-containing protein [bacterium]|nr:glycine zipper domain-containing protein [bacterium]
MRMYIKGMLHGFVIVALSTLIPALSLAQSQLYVYPQQGQSAEQQSKDRFECHNWAVQQSGFNPTNPPPMAVSQQSTRGGEVLRGGARGAATGAVIGAITGNAKKGAKRGAVIGGAVGLGRRQARKRQQRQAQAQAQAQYQQRADGYNRALSACLGGRGYTVQ